MTATDGDMERDQLERIARGSRRAFRKLFDEWAPRVYRYAMLRTGSPSDSEEILQETMLAVWSARETLVTRDSVGAWIIGIARNKTVDFLRGRANRPHVEFSEGVIGENHAQTDRIEDALDVRRILSMLSDDERELAMMVFFLELSYDEAAGLLGIPVGTVKSRMYHLRKRLKQMME